MLEPREARLLFLLVLLVVFPLLAYILLGKWSEAAKRNERVAWLAQQAAAEALRVEAMTVSSFTPVVSSKKNGVHHCARCLAPATTRCSKCKSTRYCSGRCQILHWRQIHMYECQDLDTTSFTSSPTPSLVGESAPENVFVNEGTDHISSAKKPIILEAVSSDVNRQFAVRSDPMSVIYPSVTKTSQAPIIEVKSADRQHSHKKKKDKSRREYLSSEGGSKSINIFPSNPMSTSPRVNRSCLDESSEKISQQRKQNGAVASTNGNNSSKITVDEKRTGLQHAVADEPRFDGGSDRAVKKMNIADTEPNSLLNHGKEGVSKNLTSTHKSLNKTIMKSGSKKKNASHSYAGDVVKSVKSLPKESGQQSCSGTEKLRHDQEKSIGSYGVATIGYMKMIGQKKSTNFSRVDGSQTMMDKQMKTEMLFPYEEFVKLFQYDGINLFPRGLLNIGNSCYANSVLQCLTYTKPLIAFLLGRLHSRSCCAKNWCLMCELKRHAMMCREFGPPLSPSVILSQMRSINSQMGDGSQEDAHEFLRFLVTSMQSICLEGLGGEKKVDPKLQETTFVQHTFGGRLKSKVKCLNCHHESERYENIMDLTLEIYGWVDSLEDALTQFTSPEDLDGENMYRCGRCAIYVEARKQLSIHEAPNIMTIVLKRFQEGKYGKITKCITFPEFLDMVPFMTGKEDIPPLYLLYSVIVHVDTLNASFSGHYIAYVKDLQGNWFRVDDTEVQPVSISHVMSEGAYILFYSRSSPRPPKAFSDKLMKQQNQESSKHSSSKTQKHSGPGLASHPRVEAPTKISDPIHNGVLRSASRNIHPVMETYVHSMRPEFSDATSSDWSIFTSSDDASFTTDSTRDSFSAPDCVERCNNDMISSIFRTTYAPEQYSHINSVSYRSVSHSIPQTRFATETQERGHSLRQPHNELTYREDLEPVATTAEEFPCSRNCRYFVKYGLSSKDEHDGIRVAVNSEGAVAHLK